MEPTWPRVEGGDPYDLVHYPSFPIEWSAPERLAVVSILHGGPRQPLDSYRVLELGCGSGGNLLPLACYRRHASFVGVDRARSQIALARTRSSRLGVENVQWVEADFADPSGVPTGPFDFIIAHGVFSWVPTAVRDALLVLCSERLSRNGLVYLNYNARPGWNIRGLVREFLLAETAGCGDLRARTTRAREVAAQLATALEDQEHPYSRLMRDELCFVMENHPAYVAHEYLAEENRAYWRSEFLALAGRHGLVYVGDADFNYDSGRIGEGLDASLETLGISGRSHEDTVDLLSYRQLHSPVLAREPWEPVPLADAALGELFVASPLVPCGRDPSGREEFEHASGTRVEAEDEPMAWALHRLHEQWPHGARVDTLLDPAQFGDDLRLLHRHGLLELRLVEPATFEGDGVALNALESGECGYTTSAYHTRELVPAGNS